MLQENVSMYDITLQYQESRTLQGLQAAAQPSAAGPTIDSKNDNIDRVIWNYTECIQKIMSDSVSIILVWKPQIKENYTDDRTSNLKKKFTYLHGAKDRRQPVYK